MKLKKTENDSSFNDSLRKKNLFESYISITDESKN